MWLVTSGRQWPSAVTVSHSTPAPGPPARPNASFLPILAPATMHGMARDWHSLRWWYRGERPWRIGMLFALANVLNWLLLGEPVGTVPTLILIVVGPAIFW